MLGRLRYEKRSWGRTEEEWLYGMPVLDARMDPEGWLLDLRLRRAGRGLRKNGIQRILAPRTFENWPVLHEYGLSPVSPEPLVRSQSAPLALELLRREGKQPERATVALRSVRVDRDMERAAFQLSGQVRRLVISACQGGEELAARLRRELGMPILPPEEEVQVAVCFAPEEGVPAGKKLCVYGQQPALAGLQLTAPELSGEDRTDLPLLTALWEAGQLRQRDLKIT